MHTIIWFQVPDIGLGVRVFANGPGDLGSIPGRVIPKTQKMVLDASLLNIQHYKVWIKGKVEQSREGVAPSPTPWCSSYRKGSLWVTLDYGRQLYLYGSMYSYQLVIIIIIIIMMTQKDHLILARRPDLVIVQKKENLPNRGLCHPSRPLGENQRKWKKRQVLRPCQGTKKSYSTWRWWGYLL